MSIAVGLLKFMYHDCGIDDYFDSMKYDETASKEMKDKYKRILELIGEGE